MDGVSVKEIFFFLFARARNAVYMLYGLLLKYIYGWLDELYIRIKKRKERSALCGRYVERKRVST